MTATAQTIINLQNERAAKVKPLYLALNTVIRDDSLPLEHRQRQERELRAEIDRANSDFARRLVEAVAEANREPTRRFAAGSPLTTDQLEEARLIADEYRDRTSQEQGGLVNDIRADLAAGHQIGARIKARAAQVLRIPIGQLSGELLNADSERRGARDSLDVIRELAELAKMEPIRERAAAGFASASEQMSVKEFAASRKLRWDAPLPDQVAPGYAGPSLESGVPLNAFPEPHDPERDRQREQMDRIGRDGTTPDDTAARYAARSGGAPEPTPEPAPKPARAKGAKGRR